MQKQLSAIAAVIFLGVFAASCSQESSGVPGSDETASSVAIGLAAYEREDYPMALSIFRAQAEQGNVRAQFALAVMYANGQGVERDMAAAARWYLIAAEGGVVRAQFILGMMHLNGSGVPRDDVEAARWLRMAADNGGGRARYNLGLLYEAGRGVAQDNEEARRLFQLAADQGHSAALAKLGQAPDSTAAMDDTALDDAAIEAAQAAPSASPTIEVPAIEAAPATGTESGPQPQIALVETAAETPVTAPAQTPAESLAAPVEAPTLADAQSAYESGDFASAASQFELLAELGDPRAQYTLAVMYANGQGVDQDDEQAVGLYRMAADQGHAAAQNDLGLMYANGRGVPADEMLALGLYRLAADQGHGAAQSNFAEIAARMLDQANAAYERADYAAALPVFQSLADLNDAPAQYNLGIMYENGLGVGQDTEQALRLYGLAAEQAFTPALTRLSAP